jgi:PadR family transcriptional regulator PadR
MYVAKNKRTQKMAIERWQKQMRKGLLEFLVLLCLKDDEYYGYSLLVKLKALADIDLAEGTIYPLLSRLNKEELIDFRWEIMPSGPARKYYQITPLGLETVNEMNTAWQQINASVNQAWSK